MNSFSIATTSSMTENSASIITSWENLAPMHRLKHEHIISINFVAIMYMYVSSFAMEMVVMITTSGGTDDLYRIPVTTTCTCTFTDAHSSLTSNVFNSNSTEFPCSVSNGDQDLDQWATRPHGNSVAVPLPVVKEKLAVD